MKELHTAKPLIIGLIGLPGAGKSTFADGFSNMFGAPAIDAGLLQTDIFGGKAPTREQAGGIKRAVWSLADQLFKAKRMFVLNGYANSYADRSIVREHAKKAGYDVLFVWVQTSEEVAQMRAFKPKRGATNLPLTKPAFDKLLYAFEAPRANEDHIVLSGQRTFSSQVRPILKKIAEGREPTLQPPERQPTERPPRRNIFIR